MKIQRVALAACSRATGVVVAIDVIRAFTTAAYAFAAGAQEILLVSGANEALALRKRFPDALVMGEVSGLPIAGFDLGNSPTQLAGRNLAGRRLIQPTSAGTQGVVLSTGAQTLLTSSFVCATATAKHLKNLQPASVTFVITGANPRQQFDSGDIGPGDEDLACADYLEALLRGENPDPTPYLRRVLNSSSAQIFADPTRPEFPATDIEYCTRLDHFDFVMLVERRADLHLMKALPTTELLPL